MNKIEELIEQLCPNGVVFKDIETLINNKSVSTITPPRKLTKNFYQTIGAIPIIDQGQDFIIGYTDNEEVIIDKGLYVIFGDHTEVFKYVDFPFAQGADGIKIIKTNPSVIVSKFLYYALNSYYIKTGKYTRHFSFLKKTFIPIPPLAIQQEIVSILDKFTQLEAELEAELEARRAQYEYYKNELLNFEESDKWTELKEIVDFSQGIQVDISKQSPVKKDGFVRFLRIVDFVKDNEPPRYIKNPGSRYVKNDGDLVMIRYGASAAGKVFLIYNGAIANNMFQIKLITKELDIKFLYYYLSQTKIYNFLNSNGGSSTMPAITFGQIGAVKIPIPSLAEQERIVGILDKFEALVNDISVGIPAEIKARRKQYEYYRGKLLSFNPLTTNH